MSEWQPISTAPKDGDQVLLWSEMWEMTWGIQIGRFEAGKWWCQEGSVGEDDFDEIDEESGEPVLLGPTHWMPLPEPPIPIHPDDRELR